MARLKRLGTLVFLFSAAVLGYAADAASFSVTRQRYQRQIEQQLDSMARKIRRLHSRERQFKGPARERLAGNVQMLQGKLDQARAFSKVIEHASSEDRPKQKKELDAKVIRLNKSYRYVVNTLPAD